MKYQFKDLVDISALQELTDDLYAAAAIPSAIITTDGEVLTESGRAAICTEFHRKHPEVEKECIEKGAGTRPRLESRVPFSIYTCPQGLICGSSPIVIEGEHVANVFTGQIFLSPPDEETERFFKDRARRFGFDEAAYLQAFRNIPIVTEEKFRAAISFLAKFARLVADMGLARRSKREALEAMREREDALRESKEQFRTLVEESPLAISLIRKDGRYQYANPQFSKMFGYTIEEVPTGAAWFRKAFPDKAERRLAVRTWLEDRKEASIGHVRPRVFAVTCKDGARKEILFRPVTLQNLDQFVIYEDLTEKLRLERQLRQTQKFESIGTLAGGIAHDFNNLLMGIQGRASLMSLTVDASHPVVEHIHAIEEYIRSAAGLTKQLLGFARGGKYEVKPVDINTLVMRSAAMFGRTKKEIRIHTSTEKQVPVVEVDRRQIEQVMLNLYINAWQAMPEGGDLFIETRIVTLDEDYCKAHQTTPGTYVKVSVSDTGIGMDEATRLRIFDPFFTTKEKSRGTGLGLASAYGIIKNHGGMITVYSEVGQGTTFNLYLPLSDKPPAPEADMEGRLTSGSETILLVDDEEMILDVGKAMLEKLGYRLITAKSGREAINIVAASGDAVDLVILDLIMPEMDGIKTFDWIRKIDPYTPVMLSSGYALDDQADDIMRRGCRGFIQKPFSLSELSVRVRKILDEPRSLTRRKPTET